MVFYFRLRNQFLHCFRLRCTRISLIVASTMIYLSVAIVDQVDVHQLLLISHRRLAIMADETNIAKKLQSEDLMYKAVMTKYNLPPGSQVYGIAGRLTRKKLLGLTALCIGRICRGPIAFGQLKKPRRPLQRGPPTSRTRRCRMLRGALLQRCPKELWRVRSVRQTAPGNC